MSRTTATLLLALACGFAAAEARAADASRATAEAHYKTALDYLKQKKVPLGIAELKKAIAAHPQHAMSHRALGLAYVLLNQDAKAIEEFETFIQLAPRDLNTAKMRDYVSDYYKRTNTKPPCAPSSTFDASPGRGTLKKGFAAGERAMSLGDPLSAICILERVGKDDPDHGPASLLLRTAREQAATVARAWLYEIDVQISAEQYASATARCRYLLEQFPLDVAMRAEVEKRRKEIDAAVVDARDLLYDVAARAHEMMLASDLKSALRLLCSSRSVVWRVDDASALAWERSISAVAFRMGGEYGRRSVDIASVCEQTVEPPKPEVVAQVAEPEKVEQPEPAKAEEPKAGAEPAPKRVTPQRSPEQRRVANLFQQAEGHRERQDYFRAIRGYRAVLQVDASHSAATRALKAMEDQRKALVREYHGKAGEYLVSQDLAAAAPYYERILVLEPNNPAALDGLKMYENLEKLRKGK